MQIAEQKSRRRSDNRSVCANADRKRYRRDRGKSRILSKHSKAVTDVAIEILQPDDSTFITAFLLKSSEIAESAPCMEPCLFRIHPEFGIFQNKLFEMKREFPIQLFVELFLVKQGENSLPANADESGNRHKR